MKLLWYSGKISDSPGLNFQWQLFQEISNFLDHQRFPKILAKNLESTAAVLLLYARGSVVQCSGSRIVVPTV